jgi:hypothetical protein
MIKRNPFIKQPEPKRVHANLTSVANTLRKLGRYKPNSLIRERNEDEEDKRNVEQPEQER